MTHVSDAGHPIDHVGVAVHSIEESRALFEFLSGARCSQPETLEPYGVRVAFVGFIELIEPLAADTNIGRFLERRGQGIHHVAYRTDDIEAELERLTAAGVELIDRVPRPGAGGHRVAFLQPSAAGGVLVELVERPGDG